MKTDRLVEVAFWDAYWKNIQLPREMTKTKRGLQINAILDVFDRFLPQNSDSRRLSIIEIGGAPGAYLVYIARKFGYQISALDYSETGCQKTLENLRLLGLDGKVFKKDLFSEDISSLPAFDVVLSLGFIEHFEDLDHVVEQHVKLLKPKGTLLIGIPNFSGINHLFLKHTNLEILQLHNVASMDIRKWSSFESKLGLEVIFKKYIGGFEPSMFIYPAHSFAKKILSVVFRFLDKVFARMRLVRKINSMFWSGYAIAVYRKT